MHDFRSRCMQRHVSEAEAALLQNENERLRRSLADIQAEVYGAKLAAKYLDKELSGRVQQVQLLGRDMRGPAHQRMWSQIEAEIQLNRHKTVVRACRFFVFFIF